MTPPPPPANNQGGWRRFGNGQQPADPGSPYQQGPYANQGPQQQPPANYNVYPAPPLAPASMTLPAGTWIKVHVDRLLTTDHNKTGDMFTGTLAQPIIVNGFVIAHRGQTVSGRVAVANKAGRVKGTSELGIEVTDIAIADGQQLQVKTSMLDHHGPTSRGDDAVAIGATTGVGAAIGGAVNGGVGAGVGAAAGLLVSTIGVLTTRGRPAVIYPEALVTFKVMQPVSFSTEKSSYAFQPAGPQDYAPAMQSRPMQPRPVYYPRPYWGPYPYGYPYPYFGGGIYIRTGVYRRW